MGIAKRQHIIISLTTSHSMNFLVLENNIPPDITSSSPLLYAQPLVKSLQLHFNQPTCTTSSSMTLLILLLSGDVNLNPGPENHTSNIFPCGTVNFMLAGNHLWLNAWNVVFGTTHRVSQCALANMKTLTDVVWICAHCNTPNQSDSLYHLHELEMHNHYEILAYHTDITTNTLYTSVNTGVFNPELIYSTKWLPTT